MPYIDSDYIDTGYYEGDVIVPVVPSDKIVSTTKSFILDGIDITKYVKSYSILKRLGYVYNTLTASISGYDINPLLIRNKNKRLIATIGNDTYSFIIIDADKDYKNNYELIAKTQGCLLEFPFSPVYTKETFIGSSNEIISKLCTELTIYNGLSNFTFNKGSFIVDGSKLDALNKLVAVSGGVVYEKNGRLFLVKHFRIQENSQPKFIFNDNIILNKSMSDNFDGSPLLNKVVFNPAVGDIYSEPKITMYIDDNCKLPYFLFNPEVKSNSLINSNLGTIIMTYKLMTQLASMVYEKVLKLDGAIDSIMMVSVDGEPTENYSFEKGHNVILFNDYMDGEVSVSYNTKALTRFTKKGYFDSKSSSYIYKLQYLNQIMEQSISVCDNDSDIGNSSSVSESCSVNIIDNATRNKPIIFDIVGDSPTLTFVNNPTSRTYSYGVSGSRPKIDIYGDFNHSFLETVSYENLTINKQSTNRIEDISRELGSNGYGFLSSLDLSDFLIGTASVVMSKTTAESGFIYYTTNSNYLNNSVNATYSSEVKRYTVPPCGVDNTVQSMNILGCGTTTLTYPSETINDNEVESCTIPTTIIVSVPSLLDVSVDKCSNEVISLEGGDDITLLANGTFSFEITEAKKYTFLCPNIQKGAEIYIDASNAEVA